MKRAAVACLLVVGGCAGLAGAPPAAAYNLINCGFVNGHILYSVTAETKALSNYPSAAFDAAGSWNATPTKIYFADAGSRSPQMGIDAYNFGNTDFDSITELPGCS